MNAWRRRLRAWFEARLPLSDSITLTQRTVYILPTRPGWMLALTLLLLLAGAINYQLNLGYLLTFLLGGAALVGMHVCHSSLRGLGLHVSPPQPQFANAPVLLDIVLTSNRRSVRYGIGLSVYASQHWVWCDVPAQAQCTVQVTWRPPGRGLHRLPTLSAETRFPMGTFRVWTVWRPATQVLVYPAPEAHPPPLPPGHARFDAARSVSRSSDAGDFDGVRAYRRGDALKHIVWKKIAKGGPMVSREREAAQGQELWLDWAALSATGLSTERRLERLCAWVLLADKRGLDYGLRVPGQEIALGSGEAHKRHCLAALARC